MNARKRLGCEAFSIESLLSEMGAVASEMREWVADSPGHGFAAKGGTLDKLADRLSALRVDIEGASIAMNRLATAKLAEVEADARRYRWLRSQDIGPVYIEHILFETISDDHSPPYRSLKHTADLDAAIDAAIAQGETP